VRYAALVLFALLMTTGQLLFKQAAVAGGEGGLLRAVTSSWMAGAVALYGAASVLWVWVLGMVPLSVACLYGALAYVLIPLCSAYLYGETLDAKFALGAVLIVSGVIIVTR